MLAGGIVAQVVHVDLDKLLLLGTGQDGSVDKTLEHFGQYGNDINTHNNVKVG